MGEISRGILGGFSGSVGTVVGATFRTKDIMKAKPRKSSKQAVQSQLDQRAKFELVTELLSHASTFIAEGFKPSSVFVTPMNEAVSYHLTQAIKGVSPNFSMDLSKVKFSNGKDGGLLNPKMVATPEVSMKISWSPDGASDFGPNNKNRDRTTDVGRVAILNMSTGNFLFADGMLRSAGSADLTMPPPFAGSTVHGWIYFVSLDGKHISSTDYLGSIVAID